MEFRDCMVAVQCGVLHSVRPAVQGRAWRGACLCKRLVLQGCQRQPDEVCHPRPHRLHQACWVEQQGQRAQHLQHSIGAWERGEENN
jgi:hypothetical protein